MFDSKTTVQDDLRGGNPPSGVEILTNRVSGGTAAGIEMTLNSPDNFITSNRLTGNAPDVLDAGTNNCWRHNTYTTGTVPPC